VERKKRTKSHGVRLMTMRKATHKNQSEVSATPSDLVEERLLAFAEQLGWFVVTEFPQTRFSAGAGQAQGASSGAVAAARTE
jgi:hypothetical protein